MVLFGSSVGFSLFDDFEEDVSVFVFAEEHYVADFRIQLFADGFREG